MTSASDRPAYQADGASAKVAGAGLLGVLGLAAIAAAIAFGLYAAFSATTARPPATALQRADLVPPAPRLESHPRVDRLALEAAARRRLQAYGWVDRVQGAAKIPIDRAMALQAQRGWPDPEAASK